MHDDCHDFVVRYFFCQAPCVTRGLQRLRHRYRVAMSRLEDDNCGQLSAMDAEHRTALDAVRQELAQSQAAAAKAEERALAGEVAAEEARAKLRDAQAEWRERMEVLQAASKRAVQEVEDRQVCGRSHGEQGPAMWFTWPSYLACTGRAGWWGRSCYPLLLRWLTWRAECSTLTNCPLVLCRHSALQVRHACSRRKLKRRTSRSEWACCGCAAESGMTMSHLYTQEGARTSTARCSAIAAHSR